MNSSRSTFLFLAAVLLTAPAYAGGAISTTATVEVRYRISGYGAYDGEYPARGVTVSAYTRTFLGIPRVQASGETDSDGRVTLQLQVKQGKKLRLRVETDGSLAKTFRGAWNVFLRPHRETTTLSKAESYQASISQTLVFDGELGDAVMVQDVGTRTGAFARQELSAVLPSFKKVSYASPGWVAMTSYTPWNSRVVLRDDRRGRHPEVVMHETAHTLWYQARGKWTELYWPLRHNLTGAAGNPALAMSEGFADYFAALMGDAFALDHAQPNLLDHTMNGVSAERHSLYGHDAAEWAQWGEDNEYNVMCALWDLTDEDADSGGVMAGTDATNGGAFPSGNEALRVIFASVVSMRSEHRVHASELFTQHLEGVYGLSGRETFRLNGIDLR